MHFLLILRSFWDPKCFQTSSEIWDAILEAKRGHQTPNSGSTRRNARGPGEDNWRGARIQKLPERRGPGLRSSRVGSSTPSRWGGGTLRAFRRAGCDNDVDVVDCDSDVSRSTRQNPNHPHETRHPPLHFGSKILAQFYLIFMSLSCCFSIVFHKIWLRFK